MLAFKCARCTINASLCGSTLLRDFEPNNPTPHTVIRREMGAGVRNEVME